MKKPDFIVNWQEIEVPVAPPGTSENFGFASEFAIAADLAHLRVAHLRLPPGARAYPPIALRDDEAFFFVLEGTPELWLDGFVHALQGGDGVALHAKTGIGHTFLNNSARDVRLFAISEAPRTTSRAHHPVDAAANENLKASGRYWSNPPSLKRGPHDGLTDALRGASAASGVAKKTKPGFVSHWRRILGTDDETNAYPGSAEHHGIDAKFGRNARFSRIGIHLEVLRAGRRTAWPHAERDEEEFVYVVDGNLDCWTNGYVHRVSTGDFIGWASGTGIAHGIINNSGKEAIILAGGEANRQKNQFFYPLHPRRNEEVGDDLWTDPPKHKFGPHDGLPDALRATLPKRVWHDKIKANAAAAYGAAPKTKKRRKAKKKRVR